MYVVCVGLIHIVVVSLQTIFDTYAGKEHRLKRGLEKKYGDVFTNFLRDNAQ